VLLTQRLQKQTLITYFSNLAGSVLGIIGTIGLIMNLIEEKYEGYYAKYKYKLNTGQIFANRLAILNKNFNLNKEPEFRRYNNLSHGTISDIDIEVTPENHDKTNVYFYNRRKDQESIFTRVDKIVPL
jgi:hypothetical protein